MLQLLETGKALYVLAAVCALSLLGKWITRNLYKRLIKETDNMTLTKNKYLRTLKQKAETTYRVNQGISNTEVYLEKQLYGYRFIGLTLNGWNNFSNELTLLCFLLGGAGAFAAYWMRCDSYYIVLYGAAGILSGLLCMTVDSGMNPMERRKQLLVSLQDYLENSLFGRLVSERADNVAEVSAEPEAAPVRAAARETHTVDRLAPQPAAKRVRGVRQKVQPAEQQEPVSRKDIDYLKRSLDQIAASREKAKEEDDWVKELDPGEIKVIGEILKEYLS